MIESGDDIQQYSSKRCLVLPNHQSTADIPVLFGVFHDKLGVTSNIMWVSDLELMFSHIGVVCLFHGDMFIRQVDLSFLLFILSLHSFFAICLARNWELLSERRLWFKWSVI